MDNQGRADTHTSPASEDILLEDMLLKAIDEAIESATRAGELTPAERREVIEKATNDFVRRVKKTVTQIVEESMN